MSYLDLFIADFGKSEDVWIMAHLSPIVALPLQSLLSQWTGIQEIDKSTNYRSE